MLFLLIFRLGFHYVSPLPLMTLSVVNRLLRINNMHSQLPLMVSVLYPLGIYLQYLGYYWLTFSLDKKKLVSEKRHDG